MKKSLQRVALLFAVGGFVGDVVAMALGPRAIAWYHTPGLGQALCQCEDVTRETAAWIIKLQLVATVGGGALFVVVGVIGSLVWRRRSQAAALALVSPSPPADSGG